MRYLRTLAERLSRGRRLRRRFPSTLGGRSIIVSPDAALRWLHPGEAAFDLQLLAAVRLLVAPGNVVWDIGANVGVFGFLAAARSGTTVVMIEADSFLSDLLRRSARLPSNIDLDTRILCCALGDSNGGVEFSISQRGRAASGLAAVTKSTQHAGTRDAVLVPMLTADTLLSTLPAPAVMKIDIEGAEILFLKGASHMLRNIRHVILIELFDEIRDQAIEIIEGYNYSVFGYNMDHISSELASDQDNFVAIPKEKLPTYDAIIDSPARQIVS